MRNLNKIGIALCLLSLPLIALAQVNITVNVTSSDGGKLESSELSALQGDSTIVFAVVPSQYQFSLPSTGTYTLSIAHMGYEPYNLTASFNGDSTLTAVLHPKAYELDEVEVKGKAPRQITATGEIFHLSDKAKKSGDPFRALSEIPLLNVDIMNQEVTTNRGEKLLVLIDGRYQNTGIKPIDPKFIESVEVADVVSARYLKLGVKKILNIRLKKNRPMYVFTDLRTRHDIPYRDGFGGFNSEFGSNKFAVNAYAFYYYTHKDKSDFEQKEQSGDITRNLAGESVYGQHRWEANVQMKWVPSESDYFSLRFYGITQDGSTNRATSGTYASGNQSYALSSKYRKGFSNDGYLACLYHEHTFKSKSVLSSFFNYMHSPYILDETLDDLFGDENYEGRVNYRTRRNQYFFYVDFDTKQKSYGDIDIGNQFEYTADKETNYLDPAADPYHTNRWSNYLYAGYSNSWRKMYYMASIGMETLGVETEEGNNVVWRPRISTSVSFQLPHWQSLRVYYNLDNKLPPTTSMFNTSTNPLLREEGNPFLVPEQKHEVGLTYDATVGKFMPMLYASHTWQRNIVESYIYNDGDVQVQSYRNNGTYKEKNIGGALRYSGNKLLAYIAAGYTWKSYNGQPTHGLVGVNGYVKWDFGHFFIYSYLMWQNRDYTPISTIRYKNPTEAHVQIAWQVNKHLYISLGLPYYWGVKKQTTTIDRAGYKSWQFDRFKGQSLRPWILISWTLRKNAKERIPNKMPNRSM